VAEGEGVKVLEDMAALGLLAAPPGVDGRQEQLLVEQMAAKAREERQPGGALDGAAAEGVGEDDVACADGVDQAGNA
jgi:hypothetical protein